MRMNLPVTGNTYVYPAHQTLISITDLKGRITYCNQDFIDVSGYSADELLGQPHNILRHPDVPPEAFRDFWETIQDGKIWSAILKNRRKNGDAYWVRANATPMRNGDKVVGYLSVRTLPTDQEVAETERVFAAMRQEADNQRLRYVFRRGELKRTGLRGWASWLFQPSHSHKAAWLAAVAVAVPSIAAMLTASAWGIGLVALLTATLVWKSMKSVLISPQNQPAAVAQQLASGDLSQFVDVGSAGSMRQFILPISQLALATRTVMGDVRLDLQTLLEKCEAVTTRSKGLEDRTVTQAGSLLQTSTAMEQINTTVAQTSETTRVGVKTVNEASAAVAESQAVVQSVADVMQEIAGSAHNMNEFVQVIEGVAFQTNILALNASVEAARAGEHGRGFAVVASEVRTLSQNTTAAARQIKALIQASQERIELGDQRVSQAREQMERVVAMVGRVEQMLEEINRASAEQADGVRDVSSALSQLDDITNRNKEMAAELAALFDDVHASVKEAQDNIRVFRLSDTDTTHAETDAVALRRSAKARLSMNSDQDSLAVSDHRASKLVTHSDNHCYLAKAAN